ncbi:MAG: Flp pilus assembly complex ATPase component TadA [Verrucomicrobia bacterium]|nr:Flp pilus assembly complex ATPase component TadA [Verrucomicrobiota bacterium]
MAGATIEGRRQLGKYRVVRELGRGGMALVYLVEDTELGRLVALKVLPPTMVDHATVARFHREGQAQMKLEHANIVAVYECGSANGVHFIAMEYVEGRTLRSLVRRSGRLTPDRALDVAAQVCQALEYAHAMGCIHRDIKSANVMVTESGQVKLMDFGLVQVTGQTVLTRTGSVMGTPEYMSPEQIGGELVDHRSDIYSLGVVLYEMLTGELPFTADNPQTITMMHRFEQPRPIRDVHRKVPGEVESIVMRALAKRAEDRYASASELLKEIMAWRTALDQRKAEVHAPTRPTELSARVPFRPVRPGEGRQPLAGVFMASGLVSAPQVGSALAAMSERGTRFVEALVTGGAVDEANAQRLVGDWAGLEVLPDTLSVTIPAEVLKSVPEKVVRKFHVVPLSRRGDTLRLAMADPFDVAAIDLVEALTRVEVQPVAVARAGITTLVERFYEQEGHYEQILQELGVEEEQPIEVVDEEAEALTLELTGEEATEAPIIKLVNYVIQQAVRQGASDVHIEPDENRLRVRFRVDGFLHEFITPPKHFQTAIVSRIKIMSDMDIAERRVPQDGRIKLRIDNHNVDLRVSTLPGIYGEKVVIRILDESSMLLGLNELGFDAAVLERWERMATRPYGIVLVTGPTGSGKTTTLYATLNTLNTIDTNIITVEDPVEYRLEGITQVQVNPKAGITFATGLRSIFRQDPDIIMVGEMRDIETAQISVKAALTGHLVFSTLHTNDAAGAITRLLDMGVQPYLVASSLVGAVAQRLTRRICAKCKEAYTPDYAALAEAGVHLDPGTLLFRGAGCKACSGSGYRGRTVIVELMEITEEIKQHIITTSAANVIKQVACRAGMRTLREHGLLKALAGETTLDEVIKRTEQAEDTTEEAHGR